MTGISENDLQDYATLSANLAQGVYDNRPNSFTLKGLRKGAHEKQDNGFSVKLELNPTGVVKDLYLQTSPENHAVHTTEPVTDKAPSEPVTHSVSQDREPTSLFQDLKSGLSGYLLTDTKEFNEDTQNVYIAVRGSDGFDTSAIFDLNNTNDWLYSDKFAIGDGYTPQAQTTKAAISQTISKMKKESPEAELHINSHSLGTIATIEALAQLSEEELKHVGSVDLYDGPDASRAIEKVNPKNLTKLEKIKSKITYNINAFDIVSMLNRNNGTEIGTVRYIIPLNTNGTLVDQFLLGNRTISAHDFGQIQHKNGHIVYADMATHPEIFLAGKRLSDLIAQKKSKIFKILTTGLNKLNLPEVISEQIAQILAGRDHVPTLSDLLAILLEAGYTKKQLTPKIEDLLLPVYDEFNREYMQICQDVKDLTEHKPLRPEYLKELQEFRSDWLIRLRKTFIATGGNLSTNEQVFLEKQEALYASKHYQELMFEAADAAVHVLSEKITEIQESWTNTLQQANAFAPDITLAERLDALEEAGATQETVDLLIARDIQSDINEVESAQRIYEDFISSIEEAMTDLLAKDEELAKQIEAAQQPGQRSTI